MAMAANGSVPPPRPSHHGPPGGGGGFGSNPGNQLYVGNVRNSYPRVRRSRSSLTQFYNPQLPYQAGWQDLKDLFRNAGSIVRADINIGIDGRAKGSGTVVFESAKDAQGAIG